MKKIIVILFLFTAMLYCNVAYGEDYENNPQVCTFVINNVDDEQEKEMAYYFRGKYYFDNGNYEKAILDLTESIKRVDTPEKADESYFLRAMSYYYTDNHEKAIKDFTSSIKNSSDKYLQAESYAYRAGSYMLLNNYNMAISDATKAIKIGFDTSKYEFSDWALKIYYTRGLSYYNVNNYVSAIADFTQYINQANKWLKYIDSTSLKLLLANSYYLRANAKLDAKIPKSHNEVLGIFNDLEIAIKIYTECNSPKAELAKKLLQETKAAYYR